MPSGCALGISPNDLEAIDRDHHRKCENCFQEVLLNWLRKKQRKTESELFAAVTKVNSRKNLMNATHYMYTAAIIVL